MLVRNIRQIPSGHRLLHSSQPSSSPQAMPMQRLRKAPMEGEQAIEAESSSTSSSSPLPVMEGGGAAEKEAAMKRNTDCVYFLASPLTCKKGNDCEYRHSEGARVNPRDCRYWLNGNCLNPKCSFRHPSRGGLIGIPGASSMPTLTSPIVATSQIPVQHSSTSLNPKKQSVACFFFQKEQCLKGDKCPFLHGPQSIGLGPTGTPVPQQVIKVSASVVEPPKTVNKESWGLTTCAQQQIPVLTIEKPVEIVSGLGNSASRPKCVPTNGRVDGQVMPGKRLRRREESPEQADKSDLRYRLLKQGRLHGSRSVVRPDCLGVPYSKKDHCREAKNFCSRHSSKDQQHFVPKNSSNRLQGRIKFPARNSPDLPVDPRPERQRHRERHNGRLSPSRPTLYQERHSDTMKRKLPDDFAVDARSIRSHPVRRLNSNNLNFVGPKSLAELKGAKVLDTFQKQSNQSINSRLALEQTNPIPPKDVVNLESMSPPQNGVLCSNGNGIDDAVCKNGLFPVGSTDGQSPLKGKVQTECDVTNVVEYTETENPEQTEVLVETYENDVLKMEEERENSEQTDEVYEEDVQWTENEESENPEQTEETDEVYEEDVQRTENEERENPDEAFEGEDLEAEEDAYEDDDGELDFAAKVALLFS